MDFVDLLFIVVEVVVQRFVEEGFEWIVVVVVNKVVQKVSVVNLKLVELKLAIVVELHYWPDY